jgi:hypothetical protein
VALRWVLDNRENGEYAGPAGEQRDKVMEKPTIETIEKKVAAGEELSKPEVELVKSLPNTDEPLAAAPAEDPEPEENKTPSGIKKPGRKKSEQREPEPPEDKGDDTETEVPSDKKEDKPAETAEGAPAKPAEKPADLSTKIEEELAKPEGAEDLKGFSERERGIFWELRKERLKRQILEKDNDELRFERMKREKAAEPPAPPAHEPVKVTDPLADREDDDLLTVADAKKLLTSIPKEPAPAYKPLMTPEEVRTQKVEAELILTKQGVSDFLEVLDYADIAIGTDPGAAAYLRKVKENGRNVALAAYNLIKSSPRWSVIEKDIAERKGKQAPQKPSDENRKRAEKIEENEGKVRTTGGGGNPPVSDEFTLEEIRSMSPKEFGQLPAKTRKAILERFGSGPNRP